MRKIVFGFTALLLLLTFVALNLGKWIDVTDEPTKSDIVVCLGGGTIERVKESIELLEQGYAEKQIFLLIGESWYNQPYINKNYPNLPVFIDKSPKNTKEEVLFIKNYMVKLGYKSALIVTDPPHSKRVNVLTHILDVKGDDALEFHLVSSGVAWWKAERYYDDKRSSEAVLSETIRILYSIVCYGVVEKLGVVCE